MRIFTYMLGFSECYHLDEFFLKSHFFHKFQKYGKKVLE